VYDFMHDRTEYGHKVRILTITDEFRHEILGLLAGWRVSERSVMGPWIKCSPIAAVPAIGARCHMGARSHCPGE